MTCARIVRVEGPARHRPRMPWRSRCRPIPPGSTRCLTRSTSGRLQQPSRA